MARVGLTAERVTEAAAALADDVGLEKVTMSALARYLGVKDPSLYGHVRSIGELRIRLALLAAAEMASEIALATAGRSGKNALTAFANTYRNYAIRHPGRYASMQIRFTPEEAATSAGLRNSVEVTYGLLHGYGLAEPAITDAARFLRSTFHGYVQLEATGGFGHPRDIDESWLRIVDALDAFLKNWPTAGEVSVP